MKLKLIQSGGLAGKIMTAKVSSKLTEEEWTELVKSVKKKSSSRSGRMADAFSYSIQKDEDEGTIVSIDLDAIPGKYQELFRSLFEKLKVEK